MPVPLPPHPWAIPAPKPASNRMDRSHGNLARGLEARWAQHQMGKAHPRKPALSRLPLVRAALGWRSAHQPPTGPKSQVKQGTPPAWTSVPSSVQGEKRIFQMPLHAAVKVKSDGGHRTETTGKTESGITSLSRSLAWTRASLQMPADQAPTRAGRGEVWETRGTPERTLSQGKGGGSASCSKDTGQGQGKQPGPSPGTPAAPGAQSSMAAGSPMAMQGSQEPRRQSEQGPPVRWKDWSIRWTEQPNWVQDARERAWQRLGHQPSRAVPSGTHQEEGTKAVTECQRSQTGGTRLWGCPDWMEGNWSNWVRPPPHVGSQVSPRTGTFWKMRVATVAIDLILITNTIHRIHGRKSETKTQRRGSPTWQPCL